MNTFFTSIFLLIAALFFSGSTTFSQSLTLKKGTVVIVRHAEKEAGNDPGLSDAGKRRSHDLAKWLVARKIKVSDVFVSQFRRTRQTADVVVTVFKPGIKDYKADETGEGFADEYKKAGIEKGNILVVGHSNTLVGILKQFGIDYKGEIPENEYNNIFVVRYKKGKAKFQHLKY